ncbi:DUF3383 domain-containing protein [Paraburkholderia sp. BR10936]|uniref:DUF3383 domain-containing protein n=1 Tax=Paraburkholderia sp. BR10936 TaxID=3236993 RepID=UPI0034D3614F
MTTSLPLSLVVNVQLNIQPLAPSRRNFGMIVLVTPEVEPFTSQGATWLLYGSIDAIGAAFGINSETYAAATKFFAQSPRPRQILIGRWDAADASIPATAAAIFGRPVTRPVGDFAALSSATFSVPVNDVVRAFEGIDLSGRTSFAQIATAIDGVTRPEGLGFRWDSAGTRFIVESLTLGATTQIGFVTGDSTDPDYIGAWLGLDNVAPTYIVPGVDQQQLGAQTIPEALHTLSQTYSDWYAAVVCKSPLSDDEISTTTEYIMAADRKVFGVTSMNAAQLEMVQTNVFRRLYDQQAYRVVAQYDHDDRYAIVSFLARALAVNFAGSNTTLTMKFKQQPLVTPEPITETEAAKAKALGMNYYAYFDTVPMVAEGMVIGGRFFDEIHILDWFCDAAQKNVFAVLYQSVTKVPLTDAGTHRLIAAIERACKDGVRNGAFAPGVWNGDPFGTLETGDYLDTGWYIWADTVDNLSTSDRQDRRAPPIQVALKLAGAIHHADVIVNFDR